MIYTEISGEFLGRSPLPCFDFNREPCDRILDINYGAGMSYMLMSSRLCSVKRTDVERPQENNSGCNRTHIESFGPVYNSSVVDHFDVGRHHCPLWDEGHA